MEKKDAEGSVWKIGCIGNLLLLEERNQLIFEGIAYFCQGF